MLWRLSFHSPLPVPYCPVVVAPKSSQIVRTNKFCCLLLRRLFCSPFARTLSLSPSATQFALCCRCCCCCCCPTAIACCCSCYSYGKYPHIVGASSPCCFCSTFVPRSTSAPTHRHTNTYTHIRTPHATRFYLFEMTFIGFYVFIWNFIKND